MVKISRREGVHGFASESLPGTRMCKLCRWPGIGKGGFEEVFCVRLRWFLSFVTVGFLVFIVLVLVMDVSYPQLILGSIERTELAERIRSC